MSVDAMQVQTAMSAPLQLLMLQLCNLAVQNTSNGTSGSVPGMQHMNAESKAQLQVSMVKLIETLEMQNKNLREEFMSMNRKFEEYKSLQREKEETLTLKLKKLEGFVGRKSGTCDALNLVKEELSKTVETGRQYRLKLEREKEELTKEIEAERHSSLESNNSQQMRAAEFLKEQHGDVSDKLRAAAGAGNGAAVQLLFDIGVRLNEESSNQKTLLHLAAEGGHTGTIQILLKAGAAVDATESDGYTPLHLAARGGYVDACRALLTVGAMVDKKATVLYRRTSSNQYHWRNQGEIIYDQRGTNRTALHEAARLGHVEVCELLLSFGAWVDETDERQNTPLHLAAESGHVEVVRLLLRRGADITLENSDNRTPSYLARAGKHTQAVASLSAAVCPCRQ